jgi:hypothetical protein
VKLAAAALVLLALPAQAQMYKCVDAQGKVDYRDQPAAGCKAADIRASPPISGSLQKPAEDLAVRDAELRRRQVERDAALAREREQRAALAQRCVALQQERAMLTSGLRIVEYNAQGERVFLDDAVRERRLAELTQELRGCP